MTVAAIYARYSSDSQRETQRLKIRHSHLSIMLISIR